MTVQRLLIGLGTFLWQLIGQSNRAPNWSQITQVYYQPQSKGPFCYHNILPWTIVSLMGYINPSRSFHSHNPALLHECVMRWSELCRPGRPSQFSSCTFTIRDIGWCVECGANFAQVRITFLWWLSCPEQQLKMHEEVKITDYLHRQRMRPFCGSSRTPSSSFSEFSCWCLYLFVMKVQEAQSARQSLASDGI